MKDYGPISAGVKTGGQKLGKELSVDRKKRSYHRLYHVVLFFLLLFGSLQVKAEIPKDTNVYRVYILNIKEEIAPPVWHLTQKAFQEAQDQQDDLILIHMNTYGGMLDAADSIRTAILHSEIPVYVLIDNNAASAGSLISIACDSIYMVSGANIGAATVVNQSGEVLPDKYQSYMRSMMRSTAEATGRDPQIAQAMVDPRISIPHIIDSGMVLTFTTSEAIENHFCAAKVKGIKDLMDRLGIENYELNKQEIKATDKIVRFLINPMVSGILIMLIVGGLYFELQSPGVGFPLAAAVMAAVLYFAPYYIEGMVENWEILAFFLGIALLAIELFVIPGFGFFGITGIIMVIGSLALAMVDNHGFSFTLPNLDALINSLLIVSLFSVVGLILAYYLGKRLFTSSSKYNLALNAVQDRGEGFGIDLESYQHVIGEEGIAFSMLRPAGKVKIQAKIYDAVSISSFIDKGEVIEVVAYENAQLVVQKKGS
jgi:membrane-bound serine protease (ClpP class)